MFISFIKNKEGKLSLAGHTRAQRHMHQSQITRIRNDVFGEHSGAVVAVRFLDEREIESHVAI